MTIINRNNRKHPIAKEFSIRVFWHVSYMLKCLDSLEAELEHVRKKLKEKMKNNPRKRMQR